MNTEQSHQDEHLLQGKKRQDLKEMLKEVGLDTEYWLAQLQNELGVGSAQALQHLEEKDLLKLKAQTRHCWETKALETLLTLSHSNSLSTLQKSQQVHHTLQEQKDLMSERKQRQEEAVKTKEAEPGLAVETPKEHGLPYAKPLREVKENMQGELDRKEGTVSHSENFSDGDLVRWASGGLALQGIYKTRHQRDLIEKREELLSVPKDFTLFGPEHGTRMETKEFSSSQAESIFTQTIQKLGFSLTGSVKAEGWGFNMEAGRNHSQQAESQEHQKSHSQHSYFCTTKFCYVPLASCHFTIDKLKFSKAALQELKCIEDLLEQCEGTDALPLLRHRTEAFFHRFGSHANKGPLHLGGIYWWKAVSEGFQREQLEEVKKQSVEALDLFIKGSSNSYGVKITNSVHYLPSDSKAFSESSNFQNTQTKVQLSVAHTGGLPETGGLTLWKAGLTANNKTWCVIDRGFQLVPIWDIIFSSHRRDFKDPLQVANCLKDSYTALTGLPAQIQEGEELLSANQEAKLFLEDVKSWEVSDPEEQLKKLTHFMQMLCQKIKSYDTWIKICLTDRSLQDFLVNTVNFCKESSIPNTKFIKSQLQTLLDPHIYKATNFPQAHSIMQWIFQTTSQEELVNISQLSEVIKLLREKQNALLEIKAQSKSQETMEQARRKATYEINLCLNSFLENLEKKQHSETHLLLLCISASAGYNLENHTFKSLLGSEELDYLLNEMQKAHDTYQELKNTCRYRAQAFLVLTGLTATVGIRAVPPEKKMQRLALMRHHIGQSFCKEVEHVLTKPGAHHDWENLEKDLQLLIDGKYEDTVPSLHMDEVKRQLESIFHEKKDKELYHLREKGNRSIEQHKSEIEAEKKRIRHWQLSKAFPLKYFMRSVLEILQEQSETHTKLYFLQWLSVFLNNLTMGHLEKLCEKQNYLWSHMRTDSQKTSKSSSLKECQKQIEAIAREINNCSLGIEHILREVGQIYEALEEASSTRDPLFLSLPQIAADLMISGAPIELMDGDASYVALKWVAAVFDRVSEKIGNKKLFVLSILGLQSSGKSTLLNALFGLQFTVSIQNGKIETLTPSEVEVPVGEKYESIKQDLEKYFSEDPDSEVLIQWKANFENKLIILKKTLISESKRKSNELLCLKKSQENLDEKKSSYEKELLEKSRNLALTVKGKELTEEELRKKFNQLWNKWVCHVASILPPSTEPDIEIDSENILLEYFNKEKNMVDKIKSHSGEKFQINYDQHIQMSKKYGLFKQTLEPHDIESINMTTDHIHSRFTGIVDNIEKQKCDYNHNDFHKILKMIDAEMKALPTQDRYKFTVQYKIDLSLCLFKKASQIFKELHCTFKRANDPVNYLESKKEDFFMSFKISCQGATSIKTFVDFLWHKISPAVSTTIKNNMAPKIAGDMRENYPAFKGNRSNLEKHILISLAEEENFDKYWQYLHHPPSFFRDYIKQHISRYCSDKSETIKTFLKISLDNIKYVILSAIHQSSKIAQDKSSTASEWLDFFCDQLGNNLGFPRKDLVNIEHQEIKDYEFLKEAMSGTLGPTMKRIEQDFLRVYAENIIPEIEILLSEHLCGCWNQCPCCGAICTNTIPIHEGDHSVPFHRPRAVDGGGWYETNNFAIDCCNILVASDCSMVCSDGRKIPYKKYRKAGGEYAKWNIPPDSSTQPYWKWFICHFRSKLEEKYQKKFLDKGKIPDAWYKIEKQDVLDDLNKNNIQ
ncbi:PREDICTED: interferon-induced very large GTPase 1-like [Elephantulus edwardii]|uniref:interferon-induced very large GTPase 1-like n=1 Tax=Elephantulus edwardii TaxID=28737 RepID=UPI0003F094E5|nr:PREDICTED: interferon-induced very large GTPase 1-like [Elephantulus edwardii]